jgi:aryl-alcohol dehydrogenase-like predicted oxidoreductase
MQHILQAGLSSGMSATEGIHSKKPHKVDPGFDGFKYVLPQSFVPDLQSRQVTFRGANGDVKAPYMIWGAWAWGDTATWHWKPGELSALKEAWQLAVKAGATFIDTAQAYGSGESERICGGLFKGLPRDQFIIQTKWYVVPDNATNIFSPVKAPEKQLKQSLDRMALDYVDVYIVHGHIHASSIAQVAKGLSECVKSGMTRTVGVANYSVDDMIKMADELAKYDIPLATNQCEYHILRRLPETEGMLQACRDRGIVFQSYSSLAQGRLSGKYNSEHEPPKTYRFSSYPMKDLEPTLQVLREIATARSTSISSVALNYNMSKGVVPTVGIRNPKQAEENLQAFGWRLTDEEIQKTDSVSLEGKATKLWQQG